jgi:group I intron endonuclease
MVESLHSRKAVRPKAVRSVDSSDPCVPGVLHCLIPLSVVCPNWTPVAVYQSLFGDRAQWRKDHSPSLPRAPCIYLLVLLTDPTKCYVGQTLNPHARWSQYLSMAYLLSHANRNMPICMAILKHGVGAFGLVVLQRCTIEELNGLETHWIALLCPYYNVTRGGQGSHGFKHTDATKALISEQRRGTTSSADTRAAISASNTGELNPFHGCHHTVESKDLISETKSHGEVYVYLNGVLLVVVLSVKWLGKRVSSGAGSIKVAMAEGTPFRGRWVLSRTLLSPLDQPVMLPRSPEAQALYLEMAKASPTKRRSLGQPVRPESTDDASDGGGACQR